MPDSASAGSAEDNHACFFDEVDTLPPASFPASRPLINFSQKFSPPPDAAAFPLCTRDPVAPGGKPPDLRLNHWKLDDLLFHQLTPCAPSPLALKPPTHLVLVHLVHPHDPGTSASLSVDGDEEDSSDDADLKEDQLDVEDAGSAGSFQSLGDDNVNFGPHGTGPHDLDFTNWMVAKRLVFSSRERGMAPATAQLQAGCSSSSTDTRHP
jgi:hypothetical protein